MHPNWTSHAIGRAAERGITLPVALTGDRVWSRGAWLWDGFDRSNRPVVLVVSPEDNVLTCWVVSADRWRIAAVGGPATRGAFPALVPAVTGAPLWGDLRTCRRPRSVSELVIRTGGAVGWVDTRPLTRNEAAAVAARFEILP